MSAMPNFLLLVLALAGVVFALAGAWLATRSRRRAEQRGFEVRPPRDQPKG